MVAGLDQLGRTQRELIANVGEVRRRGAGLRSLREELDTTSPGGEAIFRVFEGSPTWAGLPSRRGQATASAAARARGKRLGRPPALTQEQLREVRELLLRPENTVSGIARQLGVSRSTIYKYLPDAIHASAPSGLPAGPPPRTSRRTRRVPAGASSSSTTSTACAARRRHGRAAAQAVLEPARSPVRP